MNNPATSRAPGRVELLGNHTDYNEGVVLSAAINYAVTTRGEAVVAREATVSSDLRAGAGTRFARRVAPTGG